ncbi:MAG: hypothetical protein EXS11_04540 [Gemmataceae bacterium]|nr:hypothetical protein [Gemmataceae bacterium]
MMYRMLLATLTLPMALCTVIAQDKSKVKIQANIKVNEANYNPAIFITQTKIEKPKVDPAKPAGAGVRVTEVMDDKPKNTFSLGLGFSSTHGIQLSADLTTKENIKRNIIMAFPNLFFRIPASFRKDSDSDKKPDVSAPHVDGDPINLAGTQLLGRPDSSSLDRSK